MEMMQRRQAETSDTSNPTQQSQKQIIQASLTLGSLALGILAVGSVIIGLFSTCKEGVIAKEAPVLMAIFVAVLAWGGWKLKTHVVEGVSLLDTMPAVYVAPPGSPEYGGPPQKPPELNAWENWTLEWLLCFCAVVWGGIWILDVYSLSPLREKCEESTTGISHAFLEMKSLIYAVLGIVTLVPLLRSWLHRQQWSNAFEASMKAYRQKMGMDPPPGARVGSDPSTVAGAAAAPPATLDPMLLSEWRGGFTPQGSTQLFDATYDMARLVGYSDARLYTPSAPAEALA